MNDEPGVIVVGVDGSAGADRAVSWALGEARPHGDRVVLVHAWQYPAVGLSRYAGDRIPVFGRDDLEKLADELLTRVGDVARAQAGDVRVETRLVEGHPTAALLAAAAHARLLVVGCRGLGGFAGMLMGSVSSACAHHARCPVVIIPNP